MIAKAVKHLDRRPLVFVVEDEKAYRSYLGSTLENNGYDVYCFENGKQVLELLHHIIPDLILSDIDMPLMDGFELQGNIKKELDSFQIPLIYLTARQKSSDIERAVELGAKAILKKPSMSYVIIDTIRQTLNKK